MKGTILRTDWEVDKDTFWLLFVAGVGILIILTSIVLAIFIDVMFLIGIAFATITSMFIITIIKDVISTYESYIFHIPYWYRPQDKIRNWEKEFEEVD